MEKIINKILLIMKSSGLIETDDEIIRYGLEIVIMRGVFLILILVIGALMNCLIESIIFTVSYSVLRMYAGGCHAESRSKCFINSVLTLIIALIGIKAAEAYGFAAAALGVLSVTAVIYIFIAAPIDTENKRLDKDEVYHYGKRSRVFLIILSLFAGIMLVLRLNSVAYSVMMGMVIEAVLMLIGYLQNRKLQNPNKPFIKS